MTAFSVACVQTNTKQSKQNKEKNLPVESDTTSRVAVIKTTPISKSENSVVT